MLIAIEALRLLLVLAIIGWWGYLLVDRTRYILSLEGELVMRDASYIPLLNGESTMRMVLAEAGTLTLLVLVSSLFSFWLCVRDIRRNRALQSFYAAMAHELRTPLASIRLQAEGLAIQGKSNFIQRLLEDTTRLESQLERGLELARSETGQKLTLIPLEMAEIWQRIVVPEGLNVTGAVQGKVIADAHALQVIFRNILENARQHGAASAMQILTEKTEEAVMLTFSDNGCGTDEPLHKLSRLFYKGKQSKGTGVGLYLIQSLMRQMDGKASYASDQTGFSVRLYFNAC
jgi:signal transduction histidine kinase